MKHGKTYRLKRQAAAAYLLVALLAGFAQGYASMGQAPHQPPVTIERVSLASRAALLVDEEGSICYALHPDETIYPASLTKLLTALVVVSHCADLEEEVTVRGRTLAQLAGTGASVAGLTAGEELSVRALLAALLRPSGADAALVLAEYVGGSEAGFVRLMNDKASQLGMLDSHFVNASGLDDSGQYSTVNDLMRLWRAAIEEEALEAIVTVAHGDERWPSTLLDYDETLEYAGGCILGGKTGYTKQAGQCLASFTEIDAKRYYLVTVGAPAAAGSREGQHLADAKRLYAQIAFQRR